MTGKPKTPIRPGFIAAVVGFFSASLETFFRYNMGVRYYGIGMAVFSGLLLLVFSFGASLVGIGTGFSWADLLVFAVLMLYVPLSLLHLARARVLFRLDSGYHTGFWGDSRLQFLSYIIMPVANKLAEWMMRITAPFWLEKEERSRMKDLLPVFNDADWFTKMFIEPVAGFGLFVLFWWIGATGVSLWLLIAVPAMLMHSYKVNSETLAIFYDLRDSQLMAQFAEAAMQGQRHSQLAEEMQAEQEARAQAPPPPKPRHFSEVFSGQTDAAASVDAIAEQMRGAATRQRDGAGDELAEESREGEGRSIAPPEGS